MESEYNKEIKQVQKKLCSNALTLGIIVFTCFYVTGHIALGKGFLLGTIFGIVNFVVMGATIESRMVPSKNKRMLRALASIGVRYSIMAVPLFMAIKMDTFNVFATGAGLLSIQTLIIVDAIVKTVIDRLNFAKAKIQGKDIG